MTLYQKWCYKKAEIKLKRLLKFYNKNDAILDIGSGNCALNLQIKNSGYEITGLDIFNKSAFKEIKPVIYDGSKLPFNDNSFDIVQIITVLHHIKNPEQIVKEAKRVGKKVIIMEDIYESTFQKYITFIADSINNWEFIGHPHTNMTDDEANLAYIMSQVNITMELAILIETNYNESMGNNHLTDVTRFRNGTNGLSISHTYRNIYQTDIQVLVRRNEGGIFGRVFEVPTGNTFNQANGFATVSVDGVTDGRFSFTHEVGHLQGARHENHNANPNYARGFVSSNNTNAWRTIMARTGAAPCSQSNSCRIGSFSNPNINGPDGNPSGNSERNNARRLNESANFINSYRQVPTNLYLQNETIPANYVSNHLAKSRINTNSKNLFYQNNSVGTMRSENEIILKPGVFIQQGSDFRAYTIAEACETEPFLKQSNNNLDEFNNEIDFLLYPNPTSNIINLFFNKELKDYKIEVYSFTTKNKIFTKNYTELSKKTSIDMSRLKSDIYILKLISNNKVITRKFIKK